MPHHTRRHHGWWISMQLAVLLLEADSSGPAATWPDTSAYWVISVLICRGCFVGPVLFPDVKPDMDLAKSTHIPTEPT